MSGTLSGKNFAAVTSCCTDVALGHSVSTLSWASLPGGALHFLVRVAGLLALFLHSLC
jgi:hypothetical protein